MKILISTLIIFFNLTIFANDLICSGSNPVWNLTVKDKSMQLTLPELNRQFEITSRSDEQTWETILVESKSSESEVNLIVFKFSECAGDEQSRLGAFYQKGQFLKAGKVWYGCCKEVK